MNEAPLPLRGPITPPATIGMLGGGQLGKYALVAANAMGYRTIMLDPDPSAPTGVVANEHLVAAYDDPGSLQRLSIDCDVVTTEFENPPAAALARLAARTQMAPRPSAVAIAQDRVAEKQFLTENGFPVGRHVVLDDAKPIDDVVIDSVLQSGAIVKTARLGYDGKGQRRVTGRAEVLASWAELGGVVCVVEELLDLRCEVSVLVARTADGRVDTWPVAENIHVDGILDVSVVPARIDPVLADRAVGLAMAIADALDYVGVLAVEMFVVADESGADMILVNEMAPRPHNSGHWTLDVSVTSQFEQQIRAVCGLGLGDSSMTAPAAAMVNVLGNMWFDEPSDIPVEPEWSVVLDDPAATLHLYGKTVPRRARKMGHITVSAETPDLAVRRALALRSAAQRTE